MKINLSKYFKRKTKTFKPKYKEEDARGLLNYGQLEIMNPDMYDSYYLIETAVVTIKNKDFIKIACRLDNGWYFNITSNATQVILESWEDGKTEEPAKKIIGKDKIVPVGMFPDYLLALLANEGVLFSPQSFVDLVEQLD